MRTETITNYSVEAGGVIFAITNQVVTFDNGDRVEGKPQRVPYPPGNWTRFEGEEPVWRPSDTDSLPDGVKQLAIAWWTPEIVEAFKKATTL